MTTDATSEDFAINGIEMHCELRGPADAEPLLLLHAFTGTGRDWAHAFDLDALAARRRLVIPDLRGHGRSTNPGGTITHRQVAADVRALCDGLGLGAFVAVGASFGGSVLLHLATAEPARITAMILSGAPSYFPKQARELMARFTVETRSDEDWKAMRTRHAHGDEQIRAIWRQGNAFKDSLDDVSFTPPQLATITARTLLVDGDRDPFYPVEMFVEQYRAIPRASLWILPGAGHAPIFGTGPEFARVATAFLDGP